MKKNPTKGNAVQIKSNKKIDQPGKKNLLIPWFAVLLVAIIPLLLSNVTEDPTIAIRYLAMSLFCGLFCIYLFVADLPIIPNKIPSLIKLIFISGFLFFLWSVLAAVLA